MHVLQFIEPDAEDLGVGRDCSSEAEHLPGSCEILDSVPSAENKRRQQQTKSVSFSLNILNLRF